MRLEETSVTWIQYDNLTHHLTNDNLKVLVIDLYTLKTIYILNLIYNVLLYGCWTKDTEDINWSDSSISKRITSTDIVMILNKELTR